MSQLITAVLSDRAAREKEHISQLTYSTSVNTPPWSG